MNKKIQVILVTYNRAQKVDDTFKQFFFETSPVKEYDFLVLDNNSTDNTSQVVEKWQKNYPNISYIKNKYNVGVTGNILKAMEIASADYVWIIGDDDIFDFSNWHEVEKALENDEKVICVARYAISDKVKDNVENQLLQLTFITGGIYSTKLFDDTVMKNAYDTIYTLFSYLCPVVAYINNGGKIYVVDKAICDNGMDMKNLDYSYIRGAKADEVYQRSKTMSWIVGYCNILSRLNDKKLKENCIDTAIQHEHIYRNFENFYRHMKMAYHSKENFMQFIDVYINVSAKHAQRLKQGFLESDIPNRCDIATKETMKNIILDFFTKLRRKKCLTK